MPEHGMHEIQSSSGEKLQISVFGHKDKPIARTGILVRSNSKVKSLRENMLDES